MDSSGQRDGGAREGRGPRGGNHNADRDSDRRNNNNAALDLDEEIRTIHITNLPVDVKHREIGLLCRKLSGFEHGFLKSNAGQKPMAFVVFRGNDDARKAVADLNDFRFDPETDQRLQVSMAKQNSKKRANDEGRIVLTGAQQTAGRRREQVNQGYTEMHVPMHFNAQQMPPMAWMAPYGMMNNIGVPCSTLFISNVPTGMDHLLHEQLQKLHGFSNFKAGKRNCAFARFDDVNAAAAAMAGLSGYQLDLQHDARLNVTFARSQMKA